MAWRLQQQWEELMGERRQQQGLGGLQQWQRTEGWIAAPSEWLAQQQQEQQHHQQQKRQKQALKEREELSQQLRPW